MSCRDCTRRGGCVYTTFWLVRFLPIVLVTAATVWGSYAYTYELCFLSIDNWLQRIVYLTVFYPILILYYVSYMRTIYTKACEPPKQYYLEGTERATFKSVREDERQLQVFLSDIARQRDLTLLVRGFDHGIRFCDKCCCIKPDRSHHCSMCEQCVLKFDHHCPWVNNCVNFGNYKYFILFMGYGFVLCLWVAATTLPTFIQFWQHEYDMNKKLYDGIDSFITRTLRHALAVIFTNGRFPLVFLLFLSCMFALSLSFLFFYHLYLTAKNRTTVESFRAPMIDGKYAKDAFNHGIRANYREIFGSNALYWFLPIHSSAGDGCKYKLNEQIAMPSADHHVFVEMGGVAANQSAAHPPVSQLHSARYAADKLDETTTSSEERKSTTIHDSHDSATA